MLESIASVAEETPLKAQWKVYAHAPSNAYTMIFGSISVSRDELLAAGDSTEALSALADIKRKFLLRCIEDVTRDLAAALLDAKRALGIE